MFALHGSSIQVVFSNDQHDETEQLAQDFMAINTVFIYRQQGLRASANRKSRILHEKQQQQHNDNESGNNQGNNETEAESSAQ